MAFGEPGYCVKVYRWSSIWKRQVGFQLGRYVLTWPKKIRPQWYGAIEERGPKFKCDENDLGQFADFWGRNTLDDPVFMWRGSRSNPLVSVTCWGRRHEEDPHKIAVSITPEVLQAHAIPPESFLRSVLRGITRLFDPVAIGWAGVEDEEVVKTVSPETYSPNTADYFYCGKISHAIPGVFWLMLYGQEYVNLIGRDRYERLPKEAVEWLKGGGAIHQAFEMADAYLSDEALAAEDETLRALGQEHFFDPLNPTREARVPRRSMPIPQISRCERMADAAWVNLGFATRGKAHDFTAKIEERANRAAQIIATPGRSFRLNGQLLRRADRWIGTVRREKRELADLDTLRDIAALYALVISRPEKKLEWIVESNAKEADGGNSMFYPRLARQGQDALEILGVVEEFYNDPESRSLSDWYSFVRNRDLGSDIGPAGIGAGQDDKEG